MRNLLSSWFVPAAISLRKGSIFLIWLVALPIALIGLCLPSLRDRNLVHAQDTAKSPVATSSEELALGRARKQSKMLDTLYKTAIVLITKNYVTGKESTAAGDAFQALFQTMKETGFHEVRLLDATGEPYDEDNAPKNSFEKSAIQAMLEGKLIYEQVEERADGKRFLQTVTPIPVVMDKCVICHSNYEGKSVIGGLGIRLEIE